MNTQTRKAREKPRKLLDQVRDTMRLKHYYFHAVRIYVNWIRKFIILNDKKHPKIMSEPEVEAFLTWLAVDQNVAKSTQNQALNAIVFLYRDVLRKPLQRRINAVRAVKWLKIPVVMKKRRGPKGAEFNERHFPVDSQNPLWQWVEV
jgi:hypothetical protein